jgi:drug/metabolite transporter (DMT)-like permease
VEVIGIGLAVVTAAGVAVSNLLTRFLMRDRTLAAPQVSMISMGIGSSLLLVISLAVETVAALSITSILILVWLALVNTALAFTLWNRVLRTLTALEGGVIANAQIVEVAILAWVILGERMDGQRILAALVILLGVTLVQVKFQPHGSFRPELDHRARILEAFPGAH